MIDITVVRGRGDRPMSTIVDELLSSDTVAVYRGRQELDEHAQEYMIVSMDMVYRSGVDIAQAVKVAEYVNAPYMYSKVTDITYKVDSTGVTLDVDTRRPL